MNCQFVRALRGNSVLTQAVSAAVLASFVTPGSNAQVLEEVIVTATKRSESSLDVPLAITALSGQFIEDVNLADVKDLVTFTPGATGNSQDSFIDAISVRGIRTQDFGAGLDPSSAFFKNDLYEGRNGAAVTSLYDLDRAEVLRGPQGFLFGRNAIGGAFSVHTRRAKPGSSEGFINIDTGQRDRVKVDGAVNIPVNEGFAMRLAGLYHHENGFARNLFPSEPLVARENAALRWSATYESGALGIYTMAEYEDRKQSGSVYRAVTQGDVWEALEAALGPIDVRGSEEDVDLDRSGGDNDDANILTLGVRIDYDFDFATLTSNTGYKDHDYFYTEDYDGTPLNLETYQQDQQGHYFQQELRLTSNIQGPLAWYAGVSYYTEDLDTTYRFAGKEDFFCQYYGYSENDGIRFSGCDDLYAYYGSEFTPRANGLLEETAAIKGRYEGWGAYLNLSYGITDALQVEGGLRWTDDKKTFTTSVPTPESELGPYWAFGFSTAEPLTSRASWSDVAPRVLLKWTPSASAMVYASYTAGFKSGGFGTFSLASNAEGDIAVGNTDIVRTDGFRPDPVEQEEVDSFEVGYKDSLLDDRMNLDVVAFYYHYSDFQLTVGTESGATLTENAGEVDAWGLETSITAGIGNYLTAYLTVAYLDSEANDLEDICARDDPLGCEGRRLFWAPEWSGSLVLQGNYPMGSGAVTGALELTWESERGGGWENLDETRIDAYQEMTLHLGWQSGNNWFVEAYAENLTDAFTWDGMNNLGGKEPSVFFGPRRPRTFGVRSGIEWD